MSMTLFAVYAPPVPSPVTLVSRTQTDVRDSKVEEVHCSSDRPDLAKQYGVYGKMSQWNSSDVTGEHIDLRI